MLLKAPELPHQAQNLQHFWTKKSRLKIHLLLFLTHSQPCQQISQAMKVLKGLNLLNTRARLCVCVHV